MADSVTTGSISIGLVDGLDRGCMTSGTYMLKCRVWYCQHNPNYYLTSITGSDIAYAVDTGDFYIGDITTGPGGSEWCRLGSLT